MNLNITRDIFAVKSNSTNTAMKFYNPLCERVEKLNYFQPNYANLLTFEDNKENNITSRNHRETILLKDEDIKAIQKISSVEFPNLFSTQHQFGKNENHSLQKIENISVENKLNYKRKFFEEMIKEKREEKNNLIKELNRLSKERDDLEADIEFLNNFDQFLPVEDQIKMRGMNSEVKKSRNVDEQHFLLLKRLNVCLKFYLKN